MAPEPLFINDSYVVYTRKCIVFPADGSAPCLVDMTVRTVTVTDITTVTAFNRTMDLQALYGTEYRKMRVFSMIEVPGRFLLHWNMSPKLPLNLCVARVVGVDPDKLRSQLFWRGDVVAIKFESQDGLYIDCQDADASAIFGLEEKLRDVYNYGWPEKELADDESQSDFLDDINELKEHTGATLIDSSHAYTGLFPNLLGVGYTTISRILTTYFSPGHIITGSSILPPTLERQVFEICARSNPETCLKLMLVASRVRDWIEPILFETVVLGLSFSSDREYRRLELFMANLDRKPPGFYAKHVKNLWLHASDPDALTRILAVCSNVENLVLFAMRQGICSPFIPFLEHPGAGNCLRRLTVRLENLFLPWSTMQNFNHPCFANLTHLHLFHEDWSTFVGWEHLHSLTHLGLAYCGPEPLAIVIPKLLALKYVAICSYGSTSEYGRCHVPKSRNRILMQRYDIRVVKLEGLTRKAWESGARGGEDFWEIVEREVARRRSEMTL